jgi:sugar-specific transcriptional regulator TrmB
VLKEEDVQALMQIGFTSNQAKLYITLLGIGKADGRTIAKHSQVPRQEVYRILDELQEMGLVEKIIALPCEFEAVPMQDGLSILLAQKAKEYSEAEKKTKVLLQKFEPNDGKNPEDEECRFIIVPGKERLVKRIRDEHDNSIQSIDLVTTGSRFLQSIQYCFENYEKALERGVKYRVVLEKPEDEKAFLKNIEALLAKPNFQLRFINHYPTAYVVIFDKKEAFVAVYPLKSLIESPRLWTNNPSFLAIYQNYFKAVWNSARGYSLNNTNGKKNAAKITINSIDPQNPS